MGLFSSFTSPAPQPLPRFANGTVNLQELIRSMAEMLANEIMSAEADQLFDARTGLKRAISEVFQGSARQRCVAHLIRNCAREAGRGDVRPGRGPIPGSGPGRIVRPKRPYTNFLDATGSLAMRACFLPWVGERGIALLPRGGKRVILDVS